MASKIALQNGQSQEFSINHLDNAGALSVNSTDIALKSTIESTIAPYNKGFKNYVRNGCFRIWQRGAVINNVQDSNYTADGWVHTRNGSGATINIQQGSWSIGSIETGVGTTQNNILEFMQTVAGTGCSFNTINHRIEGVQWSSQKTLTLSFNCEFFGASADTLPQIIIRQNFGAGGSASVNTVVATNIPVNATYDWDKKSFTFTLPSISGKTVGTSPYTEIIIFLPVNKVQQFRLANVQLEDGSVATPFEQRPYGLELSLCQRYYETGVFFAAGYNVTGSSIGSYLTFKNNKRIVPTITTTTTAQTNCGGLGYTFINLDGVALYSSVTTTGGAQITGSYTASAEL